jgi:hypothetical protein
MSKKTLNKKTPNKKTLNKKTSKPKIVTKITDEIKVDLETKFQSIRTVYDAHVDLDEKSRVYAIGIFSDSTRTPKRLKRETEEIFRQVTGFRVDYRKISIVQQKVEAPEVRNSRVKFISAYPIQDRNSFIEGVVNLEFNQTLIEEKLQVHPFELELEYLIAHTTAKALMNILKEHIRIECVKEVTMGDVQVICVTLSVINKEYGSSEMVVGTAFNSKDLSSGVAKATLDAVNRKLDAIS